MCCSPPVARWACAGGGKDGERGATPRADRSPSRATTGPDLELEAEPDLTGPTQRGEDARTDPDNLGRAAVVVVGEENETSPAAVSASPSSVDVAQIRRDVPRTFPDQPGVKSASREVEELLCRYAERDPEVGYCQGMSYVAAVVTAQLAPDMDAAEARFQALVSRNRGLWTDGFPLLHMGSSAFEPFCRAHLPAVLQHLDAQGITGEMLATGILAGEWLSLFSRWQPFPALWSTFELIEAEGLASILALTAALLKAHEPVVLGAGDFAALFVLLKDLGRQQPQPEPEQLLEVARELLPEARKAIMQVEASASSMERPRSQMSITRSGSKVIHAGSNAELVVVGEDGEGTIASFALRLRATFSDHLDRVLETVEETVKGAVQSTSTLLSPDASPRPSSASTRPPSRRRLCGCARLCRSKS